MALAGAGVERGRLFLPKAGLVVPSGQALPQPSSASPRCSVPSEENDALHGVVAGLNRAFFRHGRRKEA